MFLDNFSNALAKIYNERSLTYETMAEQIGISTRYLNKLMCGSAVPTVKTIEKICKAFNVTPDELLAEPKEGKVKEVKYFLTRLGERYFPVCPHCKLTIEREYQSFCDRCGAKLDWSQFENASII